MQLFLKAVPNTRGQIHYEIVGGKRVRRLGPPTHPHSQEELTGGQNDRHRRWVHDNYPGRDVLGQGSALDSFPAIEHELQTYGFKSIDYGPQPPTPAARKVARLTARAMDELSKATGLPHKALAAHGLGLRLSKTSDDMTHSPGERLLAQYDNDVRVMTIMQDEASGDSVAHEWGHYLDNMIGIYGFNDPKDEAGEPVRFGSTWIKNNAKASFGSFEDPDFFFKPHFDIKPGSSPVDQAMRDVLDIIANFRYKQVLPPDADKILSKNVVKQIEAMPPMSMLVLSHIIDDARDERYFSLATEMFARCFSVYVAMKIEKLGIKDAVSVHVDQADFPWFPQEPAKAKLYAAFDKLMDAIRNDDKILKGMIGHGLPGRLILNKAVPNAKGQIHYVTIGGKRVRQYGPPASDEWAGRTVGHRPYNPLVSRLTKPAAKEAPEPPVHPAKNLSGKDALQELAAYHFKHFEHSHVSPKLAQLAAKALNELQQVTGLPKAALTAHGLSLHLGTSEDVHDDENSVRAAYSNDKRMIYMVQGQSAGDSLAHEWGHYLDNMIGEYGEEKPSGDSLDDLFGSGFMGISDDPKYGSFNIMENVEGNGKEEPEDIRFKLPVAHSKVGKALNAIFDVIMNEPYQATFPDNATETPDWVKEETKKHPRVSMYVICHVLDSMRGADYLASPTEMFARCFAVYASMRMKKLGIKDPVSADVPQSDYPFFPQGQAREKLYVAFDGLMDALKEDKKILKGMAAHGLPSRLILTKAVPEAVK